MTVSGGEFLSASINLYIEVISASGGKCTSTNNDKRIRKCNNSRLQKRKEKRKGKTSRM
jgi:hypothetical protein